MKPKTYSTDAQVTVTIAAQVPHGWWGVPAATLFRLAVWLGLELETTAVEFEEPMMAVVDRLAVEVLIAETNG